MERTITEVIVLINANRNEKGEIITTNVKSRGLCKTTSKIYIPINLKT